MFDLRASRQRESKQFGQPNEAMQKNEKSGERVLMAVDDWSLLERGIKPPDKACVYWTIVYVAHCFYQTGTVPCSAQPSSFEL